MSTQPVLARSRIGARRATVIGSLVFAACTVGLYFISRQNYLLFHGLVEVATIVVGVLLFMVAARMYTSTGTTLMIVLGVGFFWAGMIDLVHMLAYKGMGVFLESGANHPTQLWIFARYVQAAVVLYAVLNMRRRFARWWPSFIVVGVIVGAGLAAIFAGVFPKAYVDGSGLTQFKIVSEYVVSGLFVVSIVLLLTSRKMLDRWSTVWLVAALVLSVCAELAFTRYVSVFGPANFVGHIFKAAAYCAVFVVIVRNMLTRLERELDERKRAEASLSESEERYRLLQQHSMDAILLTTPEGTIIAANPRACAMFQLTESELCLKGRDEIVDPNDPHLSSLLEERSRNGNARGELLLVRGDGTRFPAEVSSSVFVDSEGRAMTSMIIRDITDRVEAESTIRESEERLSRAQAVAHIGNFEMDLDSNMIWSSAEACRIYGFPEDCAHLPLERANRCVVDEDVLRLEDARRGLVVDDSPFDLVYGIRRENDGAERFVHVWAEPVRFENGLPTKIVGVIQDITEQYVADRALEEAEARLVQSQKMEAVGQLAGGIAHDFNNLLTVILGYSDLLVTGEKPGDAATVRCASEIKRTAERAAALTQQILAFSRRQALQPERVSLNHIVVGLEPLLRRTLGEDISLVTHLDLELGQSEVDPHQFEQVLMNLAVNARDAMPRGGQLTLETANERLDEDYCRTHPDAQPGDFTMLSVSDTGIGMDEATRSRIFEPFFTTKRPGEGTGLGLSTAYGIVKQSGGSIAFSTELGRGTSFRVYLPRVGGPEPMPSAETPDEAGRSDSGDGLKGKTILVVEDEEALRDLVAHMLRTMGCTVLTAGTAREALDALQALAMPVDLLVTDVVLPGGMLGNDLVRSVEKLRPGQSVLYISGYPRSLVVNSGRLEEGVNYLQKPFTAAALAAKMREVFSQGASS